MIVRNLKVSEEQLHFMSLQGFIFLIKKIRFCAVMELWGPSYQQLTYTRNSGTQEKTKPIWIKQPYLLWEAVVLVCRASWNKCGQVAGMRWTLWRKRKSRKRSNMPEKDCCNCYMSVLDKQNSKWSIVFSVTIAVRTPNLL